MDNGISRQSCFILLCALCVVPLITTFLIYPAYKITMLGEGETTVAPPSEEIKTKAGFKSRDVWHTSPANGTELNGVDNKAYEHSQDISEYSKQSIQETTCTEDIEERPSRYYMKKSTFLLHILWFSLMNLRWNFFIGGLNPWLNTLSKSHSEGLKMCFFINIKCCYFIVRGISCKLIRV